MPEYVLPALAELAEARSTGNSDTVNQHEKNLAFNLAGHVNQARGGTS